MSASRNLEPQQSVTGSRTQSEKMAHWQSNRRKLVSSPHSASTVHACTNNCMYRDNSLSHQENCDVHSALSGPVISFASGHLIR